MILVLAFFFVILYKKKWLAAIISIIIFGALSFDGALLGYQYIGLEEKCALCFAVGAALFITLFGWAWIRKSLVLAVIGIAVWTAGFAANSILEVRTKTPELAETAFLQKSAGQDYAPVEMYFFFSLHCGHCSKVMANLAINEPWQVDWNICSMDNKKKDLMKLAHIRAAENVEERPFATILKIEGQKEVEPIEVPDELREKTKKARTYFANCGFKGVPLLIAEVGVGRRIINVGAESILSYLSQVGLVKKRIDFEKLKNGQPKLGPEQEQTKEKKEE